MLSTNVAILQLPPRPEILIISLNHRDSLQKTYATLFNRILRVASISIAKSADGALNKMDYSDLKAIIIADEALTELNPEIARVLSKVKAYIENGGVVIAGLHFTTGSRMDKLCGFFKNLGLPWTNGNYQRSMFKLSPFVDLPGSVRRESFPGPFSMKALHINNTRLQESIFAPMEGAKTESAVFPPSYVDCTQAGIAGAKLGAGYFFYCGDTNGEDEANQVIFALCGF